MWLVVAYAILGIGYAIWRYRDILIRYAKWFFRIVRIAAISCGGVLNRCAEQLYRRVVAKENVEELGALLWTLGASVLASSFGDFVKSGAQSNGLTFMVLCSIISILFGIRLRRRAKKC
jgi:hypothetical protein